MKRRIVTGRVLAFAARQVPGEIQLWDIGPNPTDYGVHVWNERSVESVGGQYAARGNPLLIDVEHNVGAPSEDKTQALGGYAALEIRNGAPWLIFDWSDFARSQIAGGERRFLSPDYEVDAATGEILTLFRVSLVAEPGTHRARMLASAAQTQESQMDFKMFLAALRAALANEDPAAAKDAVANLIAEADKAIGGGDAPAGSVDDVAAAADAAPPPPATDGVRAASDAPADDKDKVQAAADSKDKVQASAPATPAAAPPAAPAAGADAVNTAAQTAVRTVENATRDHILATKGDRLDPAIRRWASTQPLKVVQGLIDATPEPSTATQRVAATRGEGQGAGGTEALGLQGRDLEDLERMMGIFPNRGGAPAKREPHRLVLATMTPSQQRANQQAAQAGKGGK